MVVRVQAVIPIISIHAPRTGSDENPHLSVGIRKYFNPRSPYGERLENYTLPEATAEFQSTLPVRGATDRLAEDKLGAKNFNPRSPYGERRREILG